MAGCGRPPHPPPHPQLPDPVRSLLWRRKLGDSEARDAYERALAGNRLGTIAASDAEISHRWQEVLDTRFPSISSAGRAPLVVGKTALSYLVASGGLARERDQEDAMWLAVPLVASFGHSFEGTTDVVRRRDADRRPLPACTHMRTGACARLAALLTTARRWRR